MIPGQVGMMNHMANLHCDEHAFSESMLYWRFQEFEMSFFKGAGIVFHRHPAFFSAILGSTDLNKKCSNL
jgi:hypothetical protein